MASKHSDAFVRLVEDALLRVEEIDADTLKSWIDSGKSFTLIDTREAHEVEQGHLPNALHLSKGVIERDIEKEVPNRNQPLVLYCGGGYRSALAADNLQKMGYTDVYSLKGGWRIWSQRSFPVEGD
ncbi:MAG: rhodanese-like domain-containing protein, partial [Balneolaceae bacterium]